MMHSMLVGTLGLFCMVNKGRCQDFKGRSEYSVTPKECRSKNEKDQDKKIKCFCKKWYLTLLSLVLGPIILQLCKGETGNKRESLN